MDRVPEEPDEETAAAMAQEVLPEAVRVARFPTGLMHFVFEVISSQGQAIVVRASRREDAAVAAGALTWSALLRPLGVPLPQVLYADVTMARHPFPFVILERFPGRDLGAVVDRLTSDQMRTIAGRLAAVQTIVAGLPAGGGYGFARRLEGPFPHTSWTASVAALLGRSRRRIRAAGVVGEHHVDRVEAAAGGLAGYFAGVQATPFLHDITTKNVMIDGGQLTDIVDVDDLCFGDPLFLVGLIRVALAANGHATTYADAWVDAVRPGRDQYAALDFYTGLFSLDFMAELGHRFNRTEAAPIDPAHVARLEGLLDRYLVG
ncbi:MAG: aminoglycoside phosphotransferase family protein [Hyphomicrobiales bacterium]|nr:aminoglycoside phosphotransferase family protein [Hyphomicrobiales bacterium]